MMTRDACRAPDVKTPAWSHHALQTTPWPPAQHFLIFFIIITHCWHHFIIACSIIRILILEKQQTNLLLMILMTHTCSPTCRLFQSLQDWFQSRSIDFQPLRHMTSFTSDGIICSSAKFG